MKSIYTKLVLTSLFIIVLSSVLGFLLANIYYSAEVKPKNDEKNVQIAKKMTSYIENTEDVDLDRYLANLASIGYQIYVTDEHGREHFYGAEFEEQILPDLVKEQVIAGDVYHGMRDYPRKAFVTGFFANELKNSVGVPFQHEGERSALFIRPDITLLFNEVHVLLGSMMMGTLLIFIILVIIGARFIVRPIIKLTAATKKIQKGHFDIDLHIRNQDEIGQLAHSFEEMSQKLKQLDEMRSEFVANVSHDFQSPLQSIQGYARLLADKERSEAEKQEYLTIIEGETGRLSQLTKQLLLLTSLEKEKSIVKRERFEVSSQIKELVRKYMWRLDEKELTVTYQLPETWMMGDPGLLYNVWENLLTNAIKYSKGHGEIMIRLESKDGQILISVEDQGIGMTPGEQARIFDRFYRADHSRSIEGTGLGLSIVRMIVLLHHGEISVQSKPAEGSTFTVTLPEM